MFACTIVGCQSRAFVIFDNESRVVDRIDEATHNHPVTPRYINPVTTFSNEHLQNWLLDGKWAEAKISFHQKVSL